MANKIDNLEISELSTGDVLAYERTTLADKRTFLAMERTHLAYMRTAVSFTVAAITLLKLLKFSLEGWICVMLLGIFSIAFAIKAVMIKKKVLKNNINL